MHLYIHVPFCARRCTYCDFAIAVRREIPSAAFADAVTKEWAQWQSDPAWQDAPELQTIYFGGGTPSLLDPFALGSLLDRVTHDRPLAAGAEVTLEANPDDVTLARARAWRGAGITRVSLGVQSFEPRVLEWMHRTHDADAPARAVEALRAAGIADLSLDLIFGVPESLARDWDRDLARGLALAPEHISLYGLTVESGTALARWTARGTATPADEDRYAAEYLAAHAALRGGGFEHYEVSNAARPGHRARHNSAYWRRAPYIGLGPSAHSGLGNVRRWNLREWAAYERAMAAGHQVMDGAEELDAAAIRLENLYLGLRTETGLPARELPETAVTGWLAAGWAVKTADRVQLTAEGWLRLDAIVASVA